MVHVKKEWEFEIPNNCSECPMMSEERDGNATFYFCELKNSDNWGDIISDSLEHRDINCPLVDGKTYTIK